MSSYLIKGLLANVAISAAFFFKGWTSSALGVPIGLLIGVVQGLFVVWVLHGSDAQNKFYQYLETPAPAGNPTVEAGHP